MSMKKKAEVYYATIKRAFKILQCEGCFSQLEDNGKGEQMCINPECQYKYISRKELV